MTKKTTSLSGSISWLRRRSFKGVLLVALIYPAMASAKDTPEEKYNMDVVCEARGQIGLPIPNQAPDKLKLLTKLFAKRLQQSGPAAGKTSAQIAKDLSWWRKSLLIKAHSPKVPGHSDMLEPDTLGQFCEVLPVIAAFR